MTNETESGLPPEEQSFFEKSVTEVGTILFGQRDQLTGTYDGRVVFAVYSAVLAQLGADLIHAKIYTPEIVMRLLEELKISAMTMDSNVKGVIYMKGDEKVSKQ